jgi:hypothetical protein
MKRHQLLFLIISLLALTCKKEPPPGVHIPTLALSAVDASCTEAWLKVTTTQLPATVRLMRLTPTLQTLQTLQLTTPDTLLIDEGLLPRRTYTYKAYTLEVRGSGFQVVDSSTQATVTTMDTTSHNFTWQIDTLGDGGGSVLYDVAIINDTLAYAVGEINVRDSLGNWRNPPYNFAKWNGRTWELSTSSDAGYGYGPLYCIFAFGPNDIWAGSSIPEHWDGQRWTFHGSTRGYQGGFWIRKIFGTSPNDLYVVGDAGNIRHYDGVRWRRLESGTGLDVYDIWGDRDRQTGETEILAVASKLFVNNERRILWIKPPAITVSDSGIHWPLSSLWFVAQRHYYVVGSGVYEKRSLSETRWRNGPLDITRFYTYAIRGTGLNDVFVAGAYGELLHFGGISWQSFRMHTALNNGLYYAVAIKAATVIAVGVVVVDYPRAVAVRGRRVL